MATEAAARRQCQLPVDRRFRGLRFEFAVRGDAVAPRQGAAARRLPMTIGQTARFQDRVRHIVRRPTQARGLEASDRLPHFRGRHPIIATGQSDRVHPRHARTWRIAAPGVGTMFPVAKPKRAPPFEPQRRRQPRRPHPGFVGGNLLERERLEIRMMGISEQAGNTEWNPHSGHASNSQTNSSSCPSSQCAVTLAAEIPSPNSVRPLSRQSPTEVAAGRARSTFSRYGPLPSIA